MSCYDDTISRFDDIQDLPVSEELFGAYLEDKLTPLEHIVLQPEFETGIMADLKNEVLNDNIDDITPIDVPDEEIDSALESLKRFTDFNTNIDKATRLFQ